jgi:EAL domain-containing protein (putative c-di-GMP-specific phosphodiesterase class I)
MARQQLDMDVSFVSRFEDGRQVCGAVDGDAASFGLTCGDGRPLGETYCQRMVTGLIPHAIPDTAADVRVADLPATVAAGIGAYVGVPLELPNGSVYGTLCCLSHEARPELGQRDVAVLRMISSLLAEDLEEDARRRSDRTEVERVLADEAVDIALQPIVDVADGHCRALEALARFAGDTPDGMFRRAGNAGLRPELELLCLRQAVTVLPSLHFRQRLSVNVSPDVACASASYWQRTLPLDRLILEITEHTEVTRYDELREVLAPLRRRGLHIAVDDAGAGFASLRHILELRPDIIKIDRSLVAALDEDAARRTVVTTFVLLALDIGATVVAEGVERRQELDVLASLGVDAIQGYLLARPSVDVRDLYAWASVDGPMPWMRDAHWCERDPKAGASSAGIERPSRRSEESALRCLEQQTPGEQRRPARTGDAR